MRFNFVFLIQCALVVFVFVVLWIIWKMIALLICGELFR